MQRGLARFDRTAKLFEQQRLRRLHDERHDVVNRVLAFFISN
jgi:hypothetical protein